MTTRSAASVMLVAISMGLAGRALAIDPPVLYPGAAPGSTHVLNQTALLGNVDDPD